MSRTSSSIKKAVIGGFIFVITLIHMSVASDNTALHVLHRELYFVPILLSAFWFGLNSGFLVSILVSFLYSSYILAFSHDHAGLMTVVPQVFIFVLVGTLLGWLVEREKEHQKKRVVDNNVIVLGRAASAVAHEMKDILNALKSMLVKGEGLHSNNIDENFEAELGRLDKMVDILSSYGKQEEGRIFSHDLNSVIKDRIEFYQKTAIENGISFVAELDSDGCPSWIDPNQISWVLGKLLENALEVSSSGDKILFTSKRGGKNCTVSVKDEGPGIKPEHLKKIFSPFFTTKPGGHGLALAGCRKSLHDMGGDISVKSTLGEGAEFTIVVPREPSGKPLAEGVANAVLRGTKGYQLYRE